MVDSGASQGWSGGRSDGRSDGALNRSVRCGLELDWTEAVRQAVTGGWDTSTPKIYGVPDMNIIWYVFRSFKQNKSLITHSSPSPN